jgi:hypothetical protein
MSRDNWKVDVPEGTSGKWQVERFSVSESESQLSFIRGLGKGGRGVPPGSYTRLLNNASVFDSCVMSDTPDEWRDHYEAIRLAKGRVLINGLGLGCVLQCMLEKPEVEHLTVVEISPDVIALVAEHYQKKYGDRLTIVQADALEYKPDRQVHFDVVWHDIWPNMCEDNLPQMHKLHRKYGRKCDWQGSWSRSFIEKRRTANAYWR